MQRILHKLRAFAAEHWPLLLLVGLTLGLHPDLLLNAVPATGIT